MANVNLGNNVDFFKNQLLQAVMQNLSSHPSSPKDGQFYWNTTDNTAYIYRASTTSWVDMLAGEGGYSHPTFTSYNPDLSGAKVLATFQTNTEGHVTGLTVRDLTLADLGYVAYTHPTDGVDLGAALTGATVISDVEVNAEGHVIGFSTRDLTPADIGAVIIDDLATNLNDTWSSQKISDEIAQAVSGGTTLQGNYDAATNTPNLDSSPTAGTIKKGDMYIVSVDGEFYTEQMRAGDVLIAKNDDPTTLAEWIRAEKNQDIQNASTTTAGLIEIATETEAKNGTDTTKAITPATLKAVLDVETIKRASAFLGDGSTTSFNVVHNLDTDKPVVSVKNVSTGEIYLVGVTVSSVNAVNITFAEPPATNAYEATIIA